MVQCAGYCSYTHTVRVTLVQFSSSLAHSQHVSLHFQTSGILRELIA